MIDSSGPAKRALVIGIDSYAKLAPRYQLSGCVNDAELMAHLLEHGFGFAAQSVAVLKNEAATREGILAALDALAGRAGRDDIVVVHYSGHGSQMTDREGDEPDGFDETIMPHDSGRGSEPNRDISDDEIHAWLLHVTEQTPFVTLIFDCCHSGTITRDSFGSRARWVEPDDRPAEELPPSPVGARPAHGATRGHGPSGWLPLGQRYVLIAGCRDDESSYEHRVRDSAGIVTHGALTYFLSQELLRSAPGVTYRDVFERASARVTAEHRRQHPQMEGVIDRELFGTRDFQPMRFVPVARRAGDRVTLGAGAAQGLSTGSRWSIFPPGSKHATDDTDRLGLVEVTAVRAVSADARSIEEGEPGAIVAGARAVEDAHAHGRMILEVEIVASADRDAAVQELAARIDGSNLLRHVADGEGADVRVYLLEPRSAAGLDDPVPQLASIAAPVWAMVGRDGRLAAPVHRVDERSAPNRLRDNLEKTARFRHALALCNPNLESALAGKIDVALMREAAGGAWEIAEPDQAGGHVVYEEGDRIAVAVTNRHTAPVYISILDFGLTGAISQLYPVTGAKEQLAPGKTLQVGTRAGDDLYLHLPDGFPFDPDPTQQPYDEGTETLKIFATSKEADFRVLSQAAVRHAGSVLAGAAKSPLGQLLNMAMTGQGIRHARPNRVSPDEEWTTVSRTFTLRRKAT